MSKKPEYQHLGRMLELSCNLLVCYFGFDLQSFRDAEGKPQSSLIPKEFGQCQQTHTTRRPR